MADSSIFWQFQFSHYNTEIENCEQEFGLVISGALHMFSGGGICVTRSVLFVGLKREEEGVKLRLSSRMSACFVFGAAISAARASGFRSFANGFVNGESDATTPRTTRAPEVKSLQGVPCARAPGLGWMLHDLA